MATRLQNTDGGASALPILLATIPSLPRAMLDRLVARMIDRMDELDGDADLEDADEDEGVEDGPEGFDPEEDCCPAGDDRVMSGAVLSNGVNELWLAGSDDDDEDDDRLARLPHRRRIRQTRCTTRYVWTGGGRQEVVGCTLKQEPTAPKLAAWRRKHPRLRKPR